MILPDLAARVAWYQERLRPANPEMGTGIADWTITAEYVPEIRSGDGFAYGATCSPTDPSRYPTPEDIAAKRALIRVAVPKNQKELDEIETTLWHECNHILDSMVAPLEAMNRDAAENSQHSRDNFLKKLTPEESMLFARIMQTPMARAYRVEEGAVPEPTEGKDKKPEEGDKKPAMAEGAPREVAAIQADIVKAVLAGQPTEELAKELVAAQAMAGAAGAGAGAAPTEPPPAPTMGMKPEEQMYARKMADERKEAIEAIIDANPHLDDKQRAMARKQSSVKDARELVASYPRPANGNEPAKLGMQGNPKTGGGKSEAPMARAIREASENPMLRKALGLGALERDGVHIEPGGGILVYIDGTEQLHNQRAVYEAKKRGAA